MKYNEKATKTMHLLHGFSYFQAAKEKLLEQELLGIINLYVDLSIVS